MSASECAKQLVDQVVDILAQHGVEMDKIFAAQDDLLKVSTVWFNKFGKLEKELDDQKVLTNKLLQKYNNLERNKQWIGCNSLYAPLITGQVGWGVKP